MYPETILKAIDHANFILREGGIIVYPADTIWGIGCDATNQNAINKIYDIKGRSLDKSMIVLVSNLEQLYAVAASVHPRIDTLLHYHERPLTIIYPGAKSPYKHLTAKNGSIGIRLVKEGFCHELISSYGQPLVSTSANLSGESSPTTFGTISSHILAKADYVLPAFTEKDITGSPSVIAKYDENGELDFLR
ncbi:MAG TPA: L-threonylcarbamoyladenylate synthase [Saprospiraceae bacterium]|nr:L-threonylcarbamoyladenylate synthase [Saprospiraceae bacterium]